MKKNNFLNYRKKGVALFMAVVITGILSLVVIAITGLSSRQLTLSYLGRESQKALFMADSGAECALYWELNDFERLHPDQGETTTVTCNDTTVTLTGNTGRTDTQTLKIEGSNSNDPCAMVTISRKPDSGSYYTYIESKGYNTCDEFSSRRLERGIEIDLGR